MNRIKALSCPLCPRWVKDEELLLARARDTAISGAALLQGVTALIPLTLWGEAAQLDAAVTLRAAAVFDTFRLTAPLSADKGCITVLCLYALWDLLNAASERWVTAAPLGAGPTTGDWLIITYAEKCPTEWCLRGAVLIHQAHPLKGTSMLDEAVHATDTILCG